MNKLKLMEKHKRMFGGEFSRKDGRNIYKSSPTDEGVIVTFKWLSSCQQNLKNSQNSIVSEVMEPVEVVEPTVEIVEPKVKKTKKEKPVV